MKKNRGRYQSLDKNEKRASKRKYMSYEDVPLEDYRDKDPVPANMTKKFLRLFLILFLSVVLVLAVMNIEKLTPDNISHWFQYDLLGKTDGEGYPVSFSGTIVNDENFGLISGVPAYCSDTTIAVLNENAGTYQENQHAYANPIMSVNSDYGIIYNTDATGYTIIRRDNTVYSGSVKKKIFSADIAENGSYALLTESDDYLSKLTVYRSDNTEKYSYSFADYYMNTVSVNKDGSRAVLSGVAARNGGLISVIYVLDFTQDSYMQRFDVDDTFIYDVKFLNNGNAVAVGDDSAFFINIKDGKKLDIGYSSRTLTDYTLKRDSGMILSLSTNPDGRECDVFVLDSNGNKSDEIKTGKKVLSMDTKNDRLAILFTDNVTTYDLKGKITSTMESDSDFRKIVYSDSSTLYVLGKSRLSKIKIK